MTVSLRTVRRPSLAGMRIDELQQLLGSRTRALEVVRWLHTAPTFDGAPPIRAESWSRLLQEFALPAADIVRRDESDDGTTKYLVSFDGVEAETVRIPFEDRTTLCLSSQAGCSRRCGFCATATLGLTRNLRAGEIITQFILAAREAPASAPARNVVFMGMGEPMDNLDEVLRAVHILTQEPAPRLRAERVCVSTSGIVPGMVRFLRESRASLALSLNATTDAQRDEIMPQNRQWPIESLLDVLREDGRTHPRRIHFIEYVMLDGVNDTDDDSDRLIAHMHGINGRVNLIPHNAFPGNPYGPTPIDRVRAFQHRIAAAGIRCLIRMPRGRSIQAACGQLARHSS